MADPESCEEKRGPEGGDGASFGDQKAVGGNTKGGMVVEAAPPAPFIISKAQFLLELLIIALDPPSQLGQKPLFSAHLAQQIIAMGRSHSPPGKARGEPIRCSLAPSNRLPRLWRQAEGEC